MESIYQVVIFVFDCMSDITHELLDRFPLDFYWGTWNGRITEMCLVGFRDFKLSGSTIIWKNS